MKILKKEQLAYFMKALRAFIKPPFFHHFSVTLSSVFIEILERLPIQIILRDQFVQHYFYALQDFKKKVKISYPEVPDEVCCFLNRIIYLNFLHFEFEPLILYYHSEANRILSG